MPCYRTGNSDNGSSSYRDGNTLVMVLPSLVDLSVYTYLFNGAGMGKGRHAVKQLLLDCAGVRQLQDSGIAAISLLGRLASECRVQLLFLDAPAAFSSVMEARLPDAAWIDSYQNLQSEALRIKSIA